MKLILLIYKGIFQDTGFFLTYFQPFLVVLLF